MSTMLERLNAIERDLLPAEYFSAEHLVAEAQRLIASPPASAARVKAEQLDPFITGEIREEWVAALIDQKDAEERHQRRRAILTELVASAQNQARVAAGSIRESVLKASHGELVQLLDEVKQLAGELGGVRSAEAAVAADLGPEWKRMTTLAEDYNTLRSFQMARMDTTIVTQSRPSEGGEEHASDLYIRNLDDLWPEWRVGGARKGVTVTNVGGPAPRYEPWPTDPVRLLIWLATSRAQPWIPTSEQLHEHWADRRRRANPMSAPVQKPPSKPRVSYGQRIIPRIGDQPPTVKPIR